MSKLNPIVIFDFDGVLAFRDKLFHNVEKIIKILHDNHFILCIASFNRRSLNILKINNLDHLFSAWRCGGNYKTSVNSIEYDYTMKDLVITKETQIQGLLKELTDKQLYISDKQRIIFFDDNDDNVKITRKSSLFICWPIKIPTNKGIPNKLVEIIEYIVKNWDNIFNQDQQKKNDISWFLPFT